MTNDLNDQLLPTLPLHMTHNKQPRRTQQLLLLTRECINFASVIQICKLRPRQGVIFPSGGKKNLEFGMLNVKCSMLNVQLFRTQNSKLKNSTTQNRRRRLIQNSKLKNYGNKS